MALVSYEQKEVTDVYIVILNPGANVENFPPQRCPIPCSRRLYHTSDVDLSRSIKLFPAHNISAVLAEPEFKAIICNTSSASAADSHGTSLVAAPAAEQFTQRREMAAVNPASGSGGVVAWQGAGG